MQGNPNRSFSNPPLRELNSINLSQKINTTLNSTFDASKILPTRYIKEIDNSFEIHKKTGGLEGDRAVLIHRINKLQQEVDNLNKENSDLHSKLHQEKARFEDVQKKIVHSSKVKTLVDKNYLGDLKYEREENMRLKHLLRSLEAERNELRNKVREFEVVCSSGMHEKQEVMGRLQQKIDHVNIVEGDNRILADKISLMHNKMISFEKENLQIANENEKMKSLLSNLEIDNKEILDRVQEECKRYNNFVNAKNDELNNVKWAFKRQLKVVSAKNLLIALSKVADNRKLTGFLQISNFIESKSKYSWVLRKLSSLFTNYTNKALKNGFSGFKNLISWASSSKISENFIHKLSHKKFLGKIFNGWRRVTIDEIQKFGTKNKSSKKLVKFVCNQIKNSLESRINHWKTLVLFSGKQRKVMEKLVKNHKNSSLRLRFFFWKQRAQNLSFAQKVEDLSVDFAGKLIKIKFFSAFREFVQVKNSQRKCSQVKILHLNRIKKLNILNEMRRFNFKQQAKVSKLKEVLSRLQKKDLNAYLQRWKFELYNEKSTTKYSSVLSYLSTKRSEEFLKTVFLAWKNSFTKFKLTRAEEALSIEIPKREGLEHSLAELYESHAQYLQKSALQTIMNPMYRKLRMSFFHWKNIESHFKSFLHNVRYLILKHYKLNLLKGFKQWKERAGLKRFQALSYKNEKNVLEKIELNQHLLTATDLIKAKEASLAYLKEKRMKRCLSYMQNRDLANSLKIWVQKSRTLSTKISSSQSILKQLTKALHRISFNLIKAEFKRNKEKILRTRKLQRFLIIKCSDFKNLTFSAWKSFSSTMKNFRKLVIQTYARKKFTNKTLALNVWKEFINSKRMLSLQDQHQKLDSFRIELETELQGVRKAFGESRVDNEKLGKALRNKGKQRVTIALIKGCTQKMKKFWNKWKSVLNKHKISLKKSEKIIKCWRNKELRQTWHSWLVFVKEKLKFSSMQVLEKQKKDFNSFKAESKKTKLNLEQQIEFKSSELENSIRSLQKMDRFKEFLLSRSIQNIEENYFIPRTEYYFNVMKQRFLNTKSCLNQFAKTLKIVNFRRGLRDLKSYCLESIKIATLKNMLVNVFKRYGVRFLRNEFDRWTRNTWYVNDVKLKNALKIEGNKAQAANIKEGIIKMKNREKFLRYFIGKNKENFFSLWKQVSAGIKKRKNCEKILKRKTLQMKFQFFTSNLAELLAQSKETRLKTLRAMSLSSHNLSKLYFTQWKTLHTSCKSLKKALSSIITHFSSQFQTFSFHKIQSFSQNQKILAQAKKNSKFLALKKHLTQKFSKTVQFYLSFWQKVKNLRKNSEKVFKNCLLKGFHRKLRTAFFLWNEDILLKDTVDITNSQGPVAIENGILRGRIETLNKLICEEGIDSRYVEKFVLEKENQHSALTLHMIHLARYRTGLINPKDRNLLPKFFLVWKQWLVKRKKIVKVADRMMAFRRKPELMHAFLKWKSGLKLIINSVKRFNRRGLFSLIAKMDMDLKFLENKLETTHKSLMYYETYSSLLTSQVRRGQNMALLSCSLYTQKSMFQVFNRWAYYSSLCKIQEFLEQLTSTEQSLYIVKTTLRSIEEDNLTLVEENYELRQASLDGVAIAEAFETLSKERERLSQDLAERTATIKRLIDHNNELADRLRSAGFNDTPEREVLKSKRYN